MLHALFCICVASNRNRICIERVPSWRLSHGGSSYCRRGGFCCLFQLARDFILRCEKCRCVKRVCARGLAQSDGRRNHKCDCSKMLECGPFVKIDSPWPCRGQKEFLRPSRAAPHHNWWQGVIARSFGPKQSRKRLQGVGCSLPSQRRPQPDSWNLRTADLLSRLRLAPTVAIGPPDGDLMRAVLVKLLIERQLVVETSVISYIAVRLERSLDAARLFVDALDEESLARQSRITKAIARDILCSMGGGENTSG